MQTSFKNVKIYWQNAVEQLQELNRLICAYRIKEILAVSPATPERTTTAYCSNVYFEYYL